MFEESHRYRSGRSECGVGALLHLTRPPYWFSRDTKLLQAARQVSLVVSRLPSRSVHTPRVLP